MKLPPEQEAIRSKCFHPSGKFVEFPKEDVETSIPERFEKIVAEFSSRAAVKIAGNVVTYGALDTMANRVANFLVEQRGPGAEPVPLLCQSRVDQIAATLGVLKAGKFHVMLDMSSPESRIAGIMKDLQADTLLTDRQNLGLAKAVTSKGCTILLNSIAAITPIDLPRPKIEPAAIACIGFSSGSTGRPKGIIQTHRNSLHQSLLYTNLYKICADDRVGILTVNTGNTITSIFAGLLNGAHSCRLTSKMKGLKN